MSKFSVGDKVVRKAENLGGYWEPDCRQHGVDTAAVFTVNKSGTYLELAEQPGQWLSTMFRLATDLEIHQNSALPVEDHIAEKEAHVECVRNLLDEEKQKVTNLLKLNNELAEKVEGLQAEVSRCCGTIADKPKMELVIKQLSDDLVAANDQRDAAVLAAKTLGDEVQHLRQERREYRRGLAEAAGLLTTLESGVDDIDLLVLSSQLDQIGRMCDEQGNGADARLAFDAAQVVDMVGRTLTKFADE